MSNASSKHSGFHLHRNDDGTTELQILHDGAEKVAMNATGISFLGSVAPRRSQTSQATPAPMLRRPSSSSSTRLSRQG